MSNERWVAISMVFLLSTSLLLPSFQAKPVMRTIADGQTSVQGPGGWTWNWIDDGKFAVGGGGLDSSDVEYLMRQKFTAIANFNLEEDAINTLSEPGIDYLHLPSADAGSITVEMLMEFSQWAKREVASGKVLYAHDKEGIDRAATFGIGFLMYERNLNERTALSLMAEKMPGTTPNEEVLKNFQVKLTFSKLGYNLEVQVLIVIGISVGVALLIVTILSRRRLKRMKANQFSYSKKSKGEKP